MLQAELRVTSGKQSGHVIALVTNRFLIGREEDCHLRPNSDLVSRHHCVFKLDDYALRVRDLGSTNGTFVNGERLRGEVMLNTGDHVSVGKLEFEVAIGDAVEKQPAAVAASSEAEATDSFELGDTPSPSATMELPAYESENPDETAPAQFPDQPTAIQDTMVLQGDTMLSGQTPPPPMHQPQGYGQPIGYTMPYPQQQYPYAQPYGMPMMGYPQQPMPYPQMGMYPQQPMPPQPSQPPAPEASPEQPPAKSSPEVRLPKPTETGAKVPEPKAAPNGKPMSQEEATRDSAAEIIKQYTQRRPNV